MIRLRETVHAVYSCYHRVTVATSSVGATCVVGMKARCCDNMGMTQLAFVGR